MSPAVEDNLEQQKLPNVLVRIPNRMATLINVEASSLLPLFFFF
jgi:hypothetical protein